MLKEVNKSINDEKFKLLLKNLKNLKDYTQANTLQGVIKYIVKDFEEEVKINTFFDINDYIEYFLERIREIY